MTMPAFVHTRPDHDETLIARLAADDLTGQEAVEAHQLVASCPACAQLHADLRSIMAATAGLPAPRRSRDFQLTEADAARLRGTGLRRLLGRFGDPRLAFTRPLATGLVTLGIAGLVLAAAPSFLTFGAAGAAPALTSGAGESQGSGQPLTGVYGAKSTAAPSAIPGGVDASMPSPAASGAPEVPSAAGSAVPTSVPTLASTSAAPSELNLGPATDTPTTAPSAAPATDQLPPDNVPGAKIVDVTAPPAGPPPLVLISVALLVVGIGLFLLRWVARRPG